MNFDKAGIQGQVVRFSDLEHIMHSLEMIRGGQWDWDRVTYDHKFENRDTGDIYYLRVQGVAVKGEIEQSHAEVKLLTPILGHHYYPHGIEYDEEFPEVLVRKCNEKLSQLKELLDDVELREAKPLQVEDVTDKLFHISGVENITNLHVWKDGGEPVMSCHLMIGNDSDPDTVLQAAEEVLKNELGFRQTTLQIDR
ncbi:MAG TPA: YugN family protein [Bacillales bacterium]|nr:YugN family protein [Bacillales bacterium]